VLLLQVKQRVLLLAAERDLVIPSASEGPRLKRELPRAMLRLLPDRSHAMLQVGQWWDVGRQADGIKNLQGQAILLMANVRSWSWVDLLADCRAL
jgi:pimeloyl-ACP methyl ester carboxylesterase